MIGQLDTKIPVTVVWKKGAALVKETCQAMTLVQETLKGVSSTTICTGLCLQGQIAHPLITVTMKLPNLKYFKKCVINYNQHQTMYAV